MINHMLPSPDGDGEENFSEKEMEELYIYCSSNSPPTFRKLTNDSEFIIEPKSQTSEFQPLKPIPRLARQKFERQYHSTLQKLTLDSEKYLSKEELRMILEQLGMLSKAATSAIFSSVIDHLKGKDGIETSKAKDFMMKILKLADSNDETLMQKYIELRHNRMSYSRVLRARQNIAPRPIKASSRSNIMSKKYRSKLIQASKSRGRKQNSQYLRVSPHIEEKSVGPAPKKKIKIRINAQKAKSDCQQYRIM